MPENRQQPWIFGVCSRIADYTNRPAMLFRAVFLFIPVMWFVYAVLALILPRIPARASANDPGDIRKLPIRLEGLINRAYYRASPEILERMRSVKDSILAVYSRIERGDRGVDVDVRAIEQAALDYFPNSVENYLSLPESYAKSHKLADGRTPEQHFLEQLELIDTSMKKVLESYYQDSTPTEYRQLERWMQDMAADPVREVRNKLDRLMANYRPQLSMRLADKVRDIREHVLALLPQMYESGAGMSQELYNVRQTALEYLPNALEKYSSLPSDFATTRRLSNGQTAEEALLEQLALLDDTMVALLGGVYHDDAQELLIHGRFLKEKFTDTPFSFSDDTEAASQIPSSDDHVKL